MAGPDDNPETMRQAEGGLLREQEGKGYGEDEGERAEALDALDLDPEAKPVPDASRDAGE